MPIKEIVTFAMGIVMSIALARGPQNLRSNLREAQIRILHHMTRVDNWGNPSLGTGKASYSRKTTNKPVH